MNRSISVEAASPPPVRASRLRRRSAAESPNARSVFPATRVDTAPPVTNDRSRLRLAHDIGHACGTVLMLAAALEKTAGDDPDFGRFVRQLGTETRRVHELVDDLVRTPPARAAVRPRSASVRLDLLIRSITDPIRLTSSVDLDVRVLGVQVEPDSLELWRALRNLLCNALDATRSDGNIRVLLTVRGAFAVVDVHDDGPGLADGPRRQGGLGLGIVEDLATGWGGDFEIGSSPLGGCRARLLIPLSRRTASVS